MSYITYTDITKELLDSISPGDMIKVNDWKQPLKVIAVSDNYFLMVRNMFGKILYSVCEKKKSDYTHNRRKVGQFTCGKDWWLFGWNCDGFHIDNPQWCKDYLNSFETGESGLSRSSIAIEQIRIGKAK